jgi:hypothetical protein
MLVAEPSLLDAGAAWRGDGATRHANDETCMNAQLTEI